MLEEEKGKDGEKLTLTFGGTWGRKKDS